MPYATSTISYTISNLMEEGVVGKTDDERFYYDDLGFKALETKFVRGYSMIFYCAYCHCNPCLCSTKSVIKECRSNATFSVRKEI